jgi:membrane protease YdiL (CAAX protease family)
MDKTIVSSKKETSLITWGPAVAIAGVIGIYVFTQFVAYILILIYPTISHWSSDRTSKWLNNSTAAQFWVTLMVEGLSLYVLSLFLKKRYSNFRSLGLVKNIRFKDIGWGLLGFTLYFIVYVIALAFISKAFPQFNISQKQDVGFTNTASHLDLIMAFVSLVILPPIVEEILFRGFLYTGLRTKLPKIAAALIVSTIFAMPHLLESSSGILWVAGIDTFILSMILVGLREKTGSLYASMVAHMLKNFLAFAFLFHIG